MLKSRRVRSTGGSRHAFRRSAACGLLLMLSIAGCSAPAERGVPEEVIRHNILGTAYLGQTNPGYPFALAGGHMSMRTFLLYILDPNREPESADYWVEQITRKGWDMIAKDLYGGCLFTLSPPAEVAKGIRSIYGVPMTEERILEATHRTHLLGFALEQRQGAEPDSWR